MPLMQTSDEKPVTSKGSSESTKQGTRVSRGAASITPPLESLMYVGKLMVTIPCTRAVANGPVYNFDRCAIFHGLVHAYVRDLGHPWGQGPD